MSHTSLGNIHVIAHWPNKIGHQVKIGSATNAWFRPWCWMWCVKIPGLSCRFWDLPCTPYPLGEMSGELLVCSAFGGSATWPEHQKQKNLGITYKLDLIPWQDSNADHQGNVLYLFRNKKKPAPEATQGSWMIRSLVWLLWWRVRETP